MGPRDLSTFGILEIHFLTQKEVLAMGLAEREDDSNWKRISYVSPATATFRA